MMVEIACAVLSSSRKRTIGDRQLGRADAGDLDPELRRRRQRGEGEQGDAATAARELNLGQ